MPCEVGKELSLATRYPGAWTRPRPESPAQSRCPTPAPLPSCSPLGPEDRRSPLPLPGTGKPPGQTRALTVAWILALTDFFSSILVILGATFWVSSRLTLKSPGLAVGCLTIPEPSCHKRKMMRQWLTIQSETLINSISDCINGRKCPEAQYKSYKIKSFRSSQGVNVGSAPSSCVTLC